MIATSPATIWNEPIRIRSAAAKMMGPVSQPDGSRRRYCWADTRLLLLKGTKQWGGNRRTGRIRNTCGARAAHLRGVAHVGQRQKPNTLRAVRATTVRMPEELWQAVQAEAERTGQSTGDLVRQAVTLYLA